MAVRQDDSARPALSREGILEAALTLVDREGIEALGTRRLGRELAVDPMAIHYHVRGKEQLLDGVAGLLGAEVEVPPPDLEWREWLRLNLASYRAMAHRHPRAFVLLASRPVRAPAALRPLAAMLGVLRRAGFSPEEGLGLLRALSSYASGFCLAEITGFTFDPAAPAAGGDLGTDDVLEIAAVCAAAGRMDGAALYRRGLETLMAGFSPGADPA